MPLSAKRFSELRLLVSDLLQRGDWPRLFDSIGTNDPELAKAISGIFSMYDVEHVWRFVSYVKKLPAEIRRERRDSVAVVCYTLGRIGASKVEKSITTLRNLLVDDHMLRSAVAASLSNLWVLDTKKTEKTLFKFWILKASDNDDLQEISVRSSEYLLTKDKAFAKDFMKKLSALDERRFRAAKTAAREIFGEITYPSDKRISINKSHRITPDSSKMRMKKRSL